MCICGTCADIFANISARDIAMLVKNKALLIVGRTIRRGECTLPVDMEKLAQVRAELHLLSIQERHNMIIQRW